jgi:hypothetical protein
MLLTPVAGAQRSQLAARCYRARSVVCLCYTPPLWNCPVHQLATERRGRVLNTPHSGGNSFKSRHGDRLS